MKLLFVTRTYPYPPYSGDLLFNVGLIEALAVHREVELDVLCGGNLPDSCVWGKANWYGGRRTSGYIDDLRSLLGRWPRAAERALPNSTLHTLTECLLQNRYDAAILSESCTMKAVQPLNRNGIPYIYVSHNVDADIRLKIAAATENPAVRMLQKLDAKKYRHLEIELVQSALAITAITEEDAARYRSLCPGASVTVLTPGYRALDRAAPPDFIDRKNLAVLVGSFEWNAKLKNLRSILASYHSAQEALGSSETLPALRIAGRMPPSVLKELRAEYPNVEIVGEFEKIESVTADACIALVLEEHGGGFKLKMLDYIMAGIPILGFESAMAGSGLQPEEDFIAAKSFDDAMQTLRRISNKSDQLKSMAASAFAKSKDRYDWSHRAEALIELVRQK